jgi:hypothetical protein
MSMLTFYVNRAGAKLPKRRRGILEAAKDELRDPVRKDTAASGLTRPTSASGDPRAASSAW